MQYCNDFYGFDIGAWFALKLIILTHFHCVSHFEIILKSIKKNGCPSFPHTQQTFWNEVYFIKIVTFSFVLFCPPEFLPLISIVLNTLDCGYISTEEFSYDLWCDEIFRWKYQNFQWVHVFFSYYPHFFIKNYILCVNGAHKISTFSSTNIYHYNFKVESYWNVRLVGVHVCVFGWKFFVKIY